MIVIQYPLIVTAQEIKTSLKLLDDYWLKKKDTINTRDLGQWLANIQFMHVLKALYIVHKWKGEPWDLINYESIARFYGINGVVEEKDIV